MPSKDLIKRWLATVDDFFKGGSNSSSTQIIESGGRNPEDQKSNSQSKKSEDKSDEKRIGVHCVAGLGRAPFLVAIALVNNGCSPGNAIELIRRNRPGALNLT